MTTWQRVVYCTKSVEGERFTVIWRRHYNEVRPHMSLQHQTPAGFKASLVLQIEQPGGESREAVQPQ